MTLSTGLSLQSTHIPGYLRNPGDCEPEPLIGLLNSAQMTSGSVSYFILINCLPFDMSINKHFSKFWQAFIHPRVIIFILIGTGIIFLTFFTDSNGLEIAISGIASVFIGIGVNNLSAIETHWKDEQKLKEKVGLSLKVMNMVKSKIDRLHFEIKTGNCRGIQTEFEELNQFIDLGIQLIKEEKLLD
jgi:hypothetical protein